MIAPPREVTEAMFEVALEGARASWNTGSNVDRWMSLDDLRVIVTGALNAALNAPREVTEAMVEDAARALWRLDNPIEDGFSIVAPNDWDRWPEHGRNASLAQADHSKDDYRNQARAALNAALNAPARVDARSLDAETRASMFIEWCALHGFGCEGWPEGAHAQLVAHIREGELPVTLSEMRDIRGGEVGEITRTPEEQAALERAMEDVGKP